MMNASRLRILALLATVSASTLVTLEACSGDSSNGDAGPDATANDASSDVAQQDAAKDVVQSGDGSCPSYNGSIAFCKAAVDRCNACPGTTNISACQAANFDAVCNGIANIFSTQYQGALESCATLCDQDAETACQKSAMADASLSTAQQQVATNYCSHCATDAGCAATIASDINLIEFSDTLANTIDTNCTPDAGPDSSTCGFGFVGCVLGVETAALKALPCADASTD